MGSQNQSLDDLFKDEPATVMHPECIKLKEENEWGEHPDFLREQWRDDVSDGSTQLGYWEWASHRLEERDVEEAGKKAKIVDGHLIIEVTEFIRPHGKREPRQYRLSPELQSKYQEVLDAGCRLTLERTPGIGLSLCIENDEADFDVQFCSPLNLTNTFASMIAKFDTAKYEVWKQQFANGGPDDESGEGAF